MGNSNAESKAMQQLPHILPDYMLVFAIPVLAHEPRLTRYVSVEYIKYIFPTTTEYYTHMREYCDCLLYKEMVIHLESNKVEWLMIWNCSSFRVLSRRLL